MGVENFMWTIEKNFTTACQANLCPDCFSNLIELCASYSGDIFLCQHIIKVSTIFNFSQILMFFNTAIKINNCIKKPLFI